MEFIAINERKLKISLTRQDMDRLSVCGEELDYDRTETRRAIWEILDEAKQRTGFDAARERIMIQAFTGRDGGCELFVFKLGMPAGGVAAAGEERLPAMCRSAVEKRSAFRFANIDILLQACRLLQMKNFCGESAAFCDREGGYSLLLSACGDYPFLYEFTHPDGATSASYIPEHQICIAEKDAVDVLAALAL